MKTSSKHQIDGETPDPTKTMALLIDETAGRYVPQRFCQQQVPTIWIGANHYLHQAWRICRLGGPNHPEYWDAWEDIERNATHIDSDGNKWTLDLDGDLWAKRQDAQNFDLVL